MIRAAVLILIAVAALAWWSGGSTDESRTIRAFGYECERVSQKTMDGSDEVVICDNGTRYRISMNGLSVSVKVDPQ